MTMPSTKDQFLLLLHHPIIPSVDDVQFVQIISRFNCSGWWLRGLVGHLTDSDQYLPLCRCDSPKPTALHKVHGTTVEALTGADRPRQRAPPSFPPIVIRLKSTRVTGEPFTGEFLGNHYRPLSWHFLLWRVRVSCHSCQRMGFPGDFDAAAKPKAVGEAKGASGEARIHHLCEERKVLTLCSSHLNPS